MRPQDFHMVCTEIHYNYRQVVSDGKEIFPDGWDTHKVGVNGVVEIKEHCAAGEGDRWFYDVLKENGDVERIFYPHRVFYKMP